MTTAARPSNGTTETEEPRVLSPAQEAVREHVLATIAPDAAGSPRAHAILAQWENALVEAAASEATAWPVRNPQTLAAVADYHVAYLRRQLAKDTYDGAVLDLEAAESATGKRFAHWEQLPDNHSLALNWMRVALEFREPDLDPKDVVRASLFVIQNMDEEGWKELAGGTISPVLQERFCSVPTEYLSNLGSLMLAAPEAMQGIIAAIFENPGHVRPLTLLLSTFTAATR